MLRLLEPKVSGDFATEICKKIGFQNWIRVEAVGFSGRIMGFLWKENIHIDILQTHPQFILLQVHQTTVTLWLCSIVYASHIPLLRRRLWQDLSPASIPFDGPWLSVGDLLGSIPMWPCLPQGERPPLLLRSFFNHVFWQLLRRVSSHVCWLLLRNKCSFDFFLLQMLINRQATEGNYTIPIPSLLL